MDQAFQQTALMKRYHEVPVFFDGQINAITLNQSDCELELLLKAMHNPRFKKDTLIVIRCLHVISFSLARAHFDSVLIRIRDFDVKRLDDGLHLRIEDREGAVHEIVFESIEMYEKTGY
jgi:hypothetical protein